MGNLIDIPIITPLLHQSEVSWQYETVSQTTSCYGLKNNVIYLYIINLQIQIHS